MDNFTREQLTSGRVVRKAIIRGGIIQGAITQGAFVRGTIFLEEISSGAAFPEAIIRGQLCKMQLSVEQLSGENFPLGQLPRTGLFLIQIALILFIATRKRHFFLETILTFYLI